MKSGTVIDGKYKVKGICSQSGGMGTILFVDPVDDVFFDPAVLKYCTETEEENITRFKREVRLLQTFNGNPKVVEVYDAGLDHSPSYFVMKYYSDGDLTKKASQISTNRGLQEKYFIEMIDCIQVLHKNQIFHRDIKPQNFLVDGQKLVVSDFGLSMEFGSSTAFTRSSMYWGTQGYIPPEFLDGGFKHADAAGDIFMLGKTMYSLLTQRNPMYTTPQGIDPQLYSIIERCCHLSKGSRYQSLADLKSELTFVFDILNGRTDGTPRALQLINEIKNQLDESNTYTPKKISTFISLYVALPVDDRIELTYKIPDTFFSLIAQHRMAKHVPAFLKGYEAMVDSAGYSWSYAETIAENMKLIFDSDHCTSQDKEFALELAIRAAISMNRFAAMDTCILMIASVTNDELGARVASVILRHDVHFLIHLDLSRCKNQYIGNALLQLKKRNGV